MAEQLGKDNSASKVTVASGLSNSEKNNMLDDVLKINWSKVSLDGKVYNMNAKDAKRAFVWGLAIHTVADIFAHSAFVKVNGVWCHLAHGGKHNGKRYNAYADNTGKYPDRFKGAENVVSQIVKKYDKRDGAGSYVQFKAMQTVSKTFRLRDLAPNICATNSLADLSGLTCFSIKEGKFNYYWEG